MKKDSTIKEKLYFSFRVYAINLFCTILLATIGYFIFGQLTQRKEVNLDKQIITAFGTLILAPILEELIFRLVLNNISKIKNLVFASLSVFFAIFFSYYKNDGFDSRYFMVFIWVLIIWVCYFLNKKISIYNLKNFNNSLIFTSSLLFSLSHFQNYDVKNNDYSYIITFLMLFISGFLLAKVRIKAGILWSIFTHFLFNLIPSLIIIFEHFKK